MVDAVIGNYQLVRKLGEGGMGVVFLGQHQLLGRRAAIKVLLPELSARPDIVNRFFNEARAVTSISDPGIVQVFDFGYHTDGSAFIVMEFLDGEPLDRRLARCGRLPVGEALRLARQLALSLAAAHAQRIVHRDLKPENIFLVPDAGVASGERTKILDFGIAKLSDEHPGKLKTHTGMLMGTPVYMSPEQCRGLAEVDHRSDIYSLGCVLFHVLTGRPPFEGEAPGDILSAHIREPAPAPSSRAPHVPPSVDALVLRCLAKAVGERFQSMAELTAAVGAVMLQLPAGANGPVYMQPTTQLPIGPVAPQSGTPVPPATLVSNAGPAAMTPTTLGASVGQFASQPSRSRRVGLWIAGGLVLAAAGIGIALVANRGSPPAAVVSLPLPPAENGATAGSSAPIATGAAPAEAAPSNAAVVKTPPMVAPSHPSVPAIAPNAPSPTVSVGPAVPNAPLPAAAAQVRQREAPVAAAAVPVEPVAKPVEGAHAGVDPSIKPSGHRQHGTAASPLREPPATSQAVGVASQTAKAAPAAQTTLPAARPLATSASKCSKATFAAVYNAAAPSKEAIRAAIRSLNACHSAGAIGESEFDQTQSALVARF